MPIPQTMTATSRRPPPEGRRCLALPLARFPGQSRMRY